MVSLSFIITTHKRPDDASDCIESILKQKYDDFEIVVVTSPVGDTTEILKSRFDDSRIQIVEEDARRGPAAAGNVAFEHATGDVIVSIDDDAVLDSRDAARLIAVEFAKDPKLGILAFRIEDFDTGRVFTHEIPVGSDGHQPNVRHPTSYYIGAGAAFRSKAVDQTEGYPEDFSYHMQELDLSFQILDQGYHAVYEPGIVVRHKRSAPGRPDNLRRWRLTLENRVRVAVRHLPLRYVFSSLFVWTPYVLYRTRGSIGTVLQAYRNLLYDMGNLYSQREVIDAATRRRIRRQSGRLWY